MFSRSHTNGTSHREAVRRAYGASLLAGTLMLAGCGGGGGGGATQNPLPPSSTSPPAADEGELLITLTDAPGDFTTYNVVVDGVELVRANGDVVQTLPLSTTVDFAELTEVTEILTAATVPVGTYTSVSMTLDYTDAEIWVENDAGDEVPATVVDIDGEPVGTMTMDCL